MSYIVIPGKRRRQPSGFAPIRPYWIGRGLVFLFNGATFFDHYRGIQAANTGAVGQRGNVGGGIAADISGTQYLSWASRDDLNITGALTVFWKGVFDGTSGAYRNVISKATGNASTYTPFDFYLSNAASSLFTIVRASAGLYRGYECTTTPIVANVPVTLGMMCASGAIDSAPTAYVNQTPQATNSVGSGSGTTAAASSTDLRLGRRVDNGTQMDGGPELVALFNQCLSNEEYLVLSRDAVGELFVPEIRRIFFGAGGGTTGTTVGTYTGSGGVTLGGAATLAKTKAATASGGATLAGTAPSTKTKAFTPTGGVTIAGTAPLAKTKAGTASGGLALAGAATTAYEAGGLNVIGTYVGSGGVTLAGAATLAKTKAYVPSGQISLAGSAALAKTRVFIPAGGVTLAGSATTSYVEFTLLDAQYTGSGGIELAGTAETQGPSDELGGRLLRRRKRYLVKDRVYDDLDPADVIAAAKEAGVDLGDVREVVKQPSAHKARPRHADDEGREYWLPQEFWGRAAKQQRQEATSPLPPDFWRAVEAIRPAGAGNTAASALQAQALRQRQEDEALLLLLS